MNRVVLFELVGFGLRVARTIKANQLTPVGLTVVLIFALTGCEPSPPPDDTVIDIEGTSFVIGKSPDVVDQEFIIFTGASTESFTLDLDLKAPATAPLRARAGGGDLIDTFVAADTAVQIDVPGNVARLEFESNGMSEAPGFQIDSATLSHAAGTSFPVLAPELADRVTALPLTLGKPVELILPDGARYTFLSVSNVAGLNLDITIDGPGSSNNAEVYLVTDSTAEWALSTDGAEFVIAPGIGGFFNLQMPTTRDTLYLTVYKPEDTPAGHARLTVLDAGIQQSGSVKATIFVQDDLNQWQRDALRASFREAAAVIYRVTWGRLLIDQFTLTVTELGGIPAFSDDLYIATVGVDVDELPPLPGGAPLIASSSFSIDGARLAKNIFEGKYGLPDESGLCPNSLMDSNPYHLCWAQNHNPNDSSSLEEDSAWSLLVAATGLLAPASKPPYIFRNVTAVRPPTTVSIQ